MKSFFKKLFTNGEVLEIVNSPINGEVRVVEDFSGRSMIIGGVSQSGYLVEKLWRTAIRQIFNLKFLIFNQDLNYSNFKCLILGLGCGNAAKIVSDKLPDCKIIGVEIDPMVIEMGKKYFGLNNIKSLKTIEFDAFKLISNFKFQISNYDLIIVDLYRGQEFPKEAEGQEFINGIKKILSNNGLVIFNRLSYGKYKKDAELFAENLKKYFKIVKTNKAVTNLLIFCQK